MNRAEETNDALQDENEMKSQLTHHIYNRSIHSSCTVCYIITQHSRILKHKKARSDK
jgi:hypothetical protein